MLHCKCCNIALLWDVTVWMLQHYTPVRCYSVGAATIHSYEMLHCGCCNIILWDFAVWVKQHYAPMKCYSVRAATLHSFQHYTPVRCYSASCNIIFQSDVTVLVLQHSSAAHVLTPDFSRKCFKALVITWIWLTSPVVLCHKKLPFNLIERPRLCALKATTFFYQTKSGKILVYHCFNSSLVSTRSIRRVWFCACHAFKSLYSSKNPTPELDSI